MVWENIPRDKISAIVMAFIIFSILLLPFYHSGFSFSRYHLILLLFSCLLHLSEAFLIDNGGVIVITGGSRKLYIT